jgi:hypothetical protein
MSVVPSEEEGGPEGLAFTETPSLKEEGAI